MRAAGEGQGSKAVSQLIATVSQALNSPLLRVARARVTECNGSGEHSKVTGQGLWGVGEVGGKGDKGDEGKGSRQWVMGMGEGEGNCDW